MADESQDAKAPEPKKKFFTLPKTGIGLGITGTFSAAMMEPEVFKGLLSAAWKEDVVRWLVAFFVAGIMSRVILRKDLEKTVMKIVEPLVGALNNVADSNEKTAKQLVEMNATIHSHGQVLVAHGKSIQAIQDRLTESAKPEKLSPQTPT